MRVSTRGRYGLHIMLQLAMRADGQPLSLRQMAQAQGVSDKYLEQIVSLLLREKLVVGRRGANGGYQLARACEEITAGEILRALEGTTASTPCAEEGRRECVQAPVCVVAELLTNVREAVDALLFSTTLAQLAARQQDLGMDGHMR